MAWPQTGAEPDSPVIDPKKLGDPKIVMSRQLIEAVFANGHGPTTAARRVIALLLAHAGGDVGEEDREFTISKQALRQAHNANECLPKILDEIQRTLLHIRWEFTDDATGEAVAGTKIVNLLSYRIDEDGDGQNIRFRLSSDLANVMRRSPAYAARNKAAILAFESRYAITLYELGCRYLRYENPQWKGTVDELRALLGVPEGAYADFANLRRKTLDQAAKELAQYADFNMAITPVQGKGRQISEVFLSFLKKKNSREIKCDKNIETAGSATKLKKPNARHTKADLQISLDLQNKMRLKEGLPALQSDPPQLSEPEVLSDAVVSNNLSRQMASRATHVSSVNDFDSQNSNDENSNDESTSTRAVSSSQTRAGHRITRAK